MPPSGYNQIQIGSIVTFLKSVAHELKQEGQMKQLTPVQAINAECENIQIILNEENGQHYADQVLKFTFVFYGNLKQKQPENYIDFDTCVEQALQEVEKQIKAVHVPEIQPI